MPVVLRWRSPAATGSPMDHCKWLMKSIQLTKACANKHKILHALSGYLPTWSIFIDHTVGMLSVEREANHRSQRLPLNGFCFLQLFRDMNHYKKCSGTPVIKPENQIHKQPMDLSTGMHCGILKSSLPN